MRRGILAAASLSLFRASKVAPRASSSRWTACQSPGTRARASPRHAMWARASSSRFMVRAPSRHATLTRASSRNAAQRASYWISAMASYWISAMASYWVARGDGEIAMISFLISFLDRSAVFFYKAATRGVCIFHYAGISSPSDIVKC